MVDVYNNKLIIHDCSAVATKLSMSLVAGYSIIINNSIKQLHTI